MKGCLLTPLGVTCPVCGAKPGVPCGSKYGDCLIKSHPERVALWKEENKRRAAEDAKDING